ncbi:hypothetical protein NLJ89_g3445 [Agrocybe chaxingu]|uniref:Protein kinase domain-containing protein n=1 Tax=Agrocybe chaxingu TaxID=84603 RepID=A0A9W8K4U9_9AGAR|nr:hypothetical protein NLJ89_g3445 [Agrocybe chaxingu]
MTTEWERYVRKDRIPFPDGGLGVPEEFWRDYYEWFRSHGYELRSRYRPGWVHSWKGTDKYYTLCEDGITPQYGQIIDATHIPTGNIVVIKKIDEKVFLNEEAVMRHLSSGPLALDPRNHCIPLLDVLRLPDPVNRTFLITPHLRPFTSPEFETVGEVVECIRQLFEGLHFLHENKIVHRDVNSNNFMMEGKDICISGSHPQRPKYKPDMSGLATFRTRTECPQKYFFIDFGQTVVYTPEDITYFRSVVWGGDKSVPEFYLGIPFHDPYATDVYCAGNLIRREFTEGHPDIERIRGYNGLDFLKPLVSDMVQDDPSKRPTMKEVVRRFDEVIAGLTPWTLRSRVVPRNIGFFANIFRAVSHWVWRIMFILRKIPAIPRP